MSNLNWKKSLLSGFAGACALTLLHETARRRVPEAPRADVLGVRALKKILQFTGRPEPSGDKLHKIALVWEIISNTMYYSGVAKGERQGTWLRGVILGLSAGYGAVSLPKPLGLGEAPTNRTRSTQVMTVLWYLVGGLAAAAAANVLAGEEES